MKIDKQMINDAMVGIECGFEWHKTPQGKEYWKSVFNNLKELSNTFVKQ